MSCLIVLVDSEILLFLVIMTLRSFTVDRSEDSCSEAWI